MKSTVLLKSLGCMLILMITASAAAEADGVERSTSLSVEGAYYLPDNKGYGVSGGGFAPLTYDPVENPGNTFDS